MRKVINSLMSMANINPDSIHSHFFTMYESSKKGLLTKVLGQDLIHSTPVNLEKTIGVLAEEVAEANILGKIWSRRDHSIDWYDSQQQNIVSTWERFHDIFTYHTIAKNSVPEDFAIKKEGKTIKIQKGSKITKILKHVLMSDYVEEMQTAISLILNQKRITGDLTLSALMPDYLTASTNNEGWRSCFHIEDGEYKASLLSLVHSPTTLIAFLPSSSKELHLPNGQTWNSKKWRAYVTFDSQLQAVHIGKHYPYHNDALEDALVAEIEKLIGKKLTIVEYKDRSSFSYYTPDSMYNDGLSSCYITEDFDLETHPDSTKRWDDSRYVSFEVCHNGPLCPLCGQYFEREDSELMVCERCVPRQQWCSCCDCYHDEEDMVWIDSEDEYLCECCADRYFSTCDQCDELIHDDNLYTVIDAKGREYSYCNHCIDVHAGHCEHCGEILVLDDLTVVDDLYTCPSCLEDIENEEEED